MWYRVSAHAHCSGMASRRARDPEPGQQPYKRAVEIAHTVRDEILHSLRQQLTEITDDPLNHFADTLVARGSPGNDTTMRALAEMVPSLRREMPRLLEEVGLGGTEFTVTVFPAKEILVQLHGHEARLRGRTLRILADAIVAFNGAGVSHYALSPPAARLLTHACGAGECSATLARDLVPLLPPSITATLRIHMPVIRWVKTAPGYDERKVNEAVDRYSYKPHVVYRTDEEDDRPYADYFYSIHRRIEDGARFILMRHREGKFYRIPLERHVCFRHGEAVEGLRDALEKMANEFPAWHNVRLGFRDGSYELAVVEEPVYDAATGDLLRALPNRDIVDMVRGYLRDEHKR